MMATGTTHTTIAGQRLADAAFFEDWSQCDSLDDLPIPDRRDGFFMPRPAIHSRYFCVLRHHVDWMGGAAFEVALPPSAAIFAIVRALPGARCHPSANQVARARQLNTLFVPATSWRELRAILPDVKSAVKRYVETVR